LEQEVSLSIIVHEPHVKIEDIIAKGMYDFNRFLIMEQEFSLVMIAHEPHIKIEDIIAKGMNSTSCSSWSRSLHSLSLFMSLMSR
jgi:hypothetical protein